MSNLFRVNEYIISETNDCVDNIQIIDTIDKGMIWISKDDFRTITQVILND